MQRYNLNMLSKKPTGWNDSKEDLLIVKSCYDGERLLTKLTIVLDMHEQILLWFLPAALSCERQVRTC